MRRTENRDALSLPVRLLISLALLFSSCLSPPSSLSLSLLSQAYAKEHIGKEAYHLYEQFRPTVAPGKRGWGQKGSPSVRTIRSLIPQQRQTTLFGRQAEKKKEEEEETAGAQKEEKEAEEERPKKRGKVSAIH